MWSGFDPGGGEDFGNTVGDADFPAVVAEVSVVVPAEQDPVVGVGGATCGVVVDVVDFAPPGGDAAAGDQASAISERDRSALVPVEDTFFGTEFLDPPVPAEHHALDDARAAGMLRGGEGDGLVGAVDVRPPGLGKEVFRADGHDQGWGGPADRGQQPAGCGHGKCGGEGVMGFLRAGTAVIDRVAAGGCARRRWAGT